MEKENRRKNKITPFPSPEKRKKDREWQDKFRRQLRREAEEIEAELDSMPELEEIDASPELFDRIIEQLRNEGKWEEETAEELTPDIRLLLSKEDREALEIGRKIQKQGKKRNVRKWISMAVVAMLCIFLATMSSEANRQYAAGVINRITGSDWGFYVENADKSTIKYSEDERKACKEIESQLGIPVPRMQYRPYGMEFESFEINKELKSGALFYKNNDILMTVYLYARMKDTTMQQTMEAQLVDEVQVEALEFTAKIYELEDIEGNFYAGEIEYNNFSYLIIGRIEKEELKKVLQSIIF